ncbi:site-specific integrase [bacterium]|nr:site-specific integrase [bacterium]
MSFHYKDLDSFLSHLSFELNYSDKTIQSYQIDLGQWESFILVNFPEKNPRDLVLNELKSWSYDLFQKKLKASTIQRKISCLRSFYKYLYKRSYIKTNWASYLISPKADKKLPKFFFEADIEIILKEPLSTSYIDYRDFLLMDILYSTGLRVSELVSLNVSHLSKGKEQFLIRGKGNKERLVFISKIVKSYIEKYFLLRKLHLDGKKSTQSFVMHTFKNAFFSKTWKMKDFGNFPAKLIIYLSLKYIHIHGKIQNF